MAKRSRQTPRAKLLASMDRARERDRRAREWRGQLGLPAVLEHDPAQLPLPLPALAGVPGEHGPAGIDGGIAERPGVELDSGAAELVPGAASGAHDVLGLASAELDSAREVPARAPNRDGHLSPLAAGVARAAEPAQPGQVGPRNVEAEHAITRRQVVNVENDGAVSATDAYVDLLGPEETEGDGVFDSKGAHDSDPPGQVADERAELAGERDVIAIGGRDCGGAEGAQPIRRAHSDRVGHAPERLAVLRRDPNVNAMVPRRADARLGGADGGAPWAPSAARTASSSTASPDATRAAWMTTARSFGLASGRFTAYAFRRTFHVKRPDENGECTHAAESQEIAGRS